VFLKKHVLVVVKKNMCLAVVEEVRGVGAYLG
jgi:hypothetical protein